MNAFIGLLALQTLHTQYDIQYHHGVLFVKCKHAKLFYCLKLIDPIILPLTIDNYLTTLNPKF